MHLVKDHELVFVACKIELGLGQLGAIGIRFQVKIDRGARLTYFVGQVVFPTCRGPSNATAG